MSGQLVGEVLAAMEPGGRLEFLTPTERLALIAIAEKCHHISRQGSVRIGRIQAAVGKSESTTRRTLRKLRDAKLIDVVKRGYKAHGVAAASIYELSELVSPMGDRSSPHELVSPMDDRSSATGLVPFPNELVSNPAELVSLMDDHLDGSLDGSVDGWTRARVSAPTETAVPDVDPARSNNHADREPNRHCATHMPYGTDKACHPCRIARISHEQWTVAQDAKRAARIAAIRRCGRCDDQGCFYDDNDEYRRCDHQPQPKTSMSSSPAGG